MRPHINVSNCLLNSWHVACDALASGAARRVMGMRLDGRCMRSILSIRPMTCRADLLGWLYKHGLIVGTVRIMATRARDASRVHQALHEIIALHAVLMRCPVGEMRKRQLAQLVVFQFPKIDQFFAHVKANRPIVVFAFDGIRQRLTLRVTLDAGVVRLHIVELGGIDDIRLTLVLYVIAAGTVASLAANVPFRDFLGVDIVIDRVASIAERPGWPLHVVGGVKRCPPVRAVLDEVRPPELMSDVPLRG